MHVANNLCVCLNRYIGSPRCTASCQLDMSHCQPLTVTNIHIYVHVYISATKSVFNVYEYRVHHVNEHNYGHVAILFFV